MKEVQASGKICGIEKARMKNDEGPSNAGLIQR